MIHFVPKNICIKHEFKILLQSRVFAQFACCHGNKVSIATSLSINTYCHKRVFLPNMNLKFFHVVKLLHNSFVAMEQCFHSHQVNQQNILLQGTTVLTTNLKYSHKAGLLHKLLVAMRTAFPWQQDYLLIYITTKNICAKYGLQILLFC